MTLVAVPSLALITISLGTTCTTYVDVNNKAMNLYMTRKCLQNIPDVLVAIQSL